MFIVGCIYRHPCMDLRELNNDYLNSLSEKLLREKNKHIILMWDLNEDLLKYTTDTSTALVLLVLILTSSNNITYLYQYKISPEEPISGNTITSISDHLAQFLLFPIEKTKDSKKKEIYKRNFKSLAGNELRTLKV